MIGQKALHSNRPNNHNLSDIATKSGFKFRDIENRKLDWKTLGCVDVNKVIDNQDYDFLEKIIPKIIEAPMQSILNAAVLDPAVSSLFRLAQLSLQYLSFCQQFMDHTLYDLRTAFNQLQKKNSVLKHNYKLLEEEHYKAQERIQSLLEASAAQQPLQVEKPSEKSPKSTSLYPCDQCTKNFLTADSLKSHRQRKHSEGTDSVVEKHELNDDSEKPKIGTNEDAANTSDKQVEQSQSEPKLLKEQINSAEREIFQLNNNNNDDEPNANCAVCAKKLKVGSTTVGIQCEDEKTMGLEETKEQVAGEKKTEVQNDAKQQKDVATKDETDEKTDDSPTVNPHEQTINELRKEISMLKNALNSKVANEPITTTVDQGETKNDALQQTKGKIDVIEQKFSAFETMYMKSQSEFIESFRSLDERQKSYMINIQQTIKEIVEQSISKHDVDVLPKPETRSESDDKKVVAVEPIQEVKENVQQEKPAAQPVEKKIVSVEPAKNQPVEDSSSDVSSNSDVEVNNVKETVCQADVHHDRSDSSEESAEEQDNETLNVQKQKEFSKEDAISDLEHRLSQFGVDADSVGLSTPRSREVKEDLAEEREEMKKAHKTFKSTRSKLKNEVDRVAKVRLMSASSVTSQSSVSHQSDDKLSDEMPKTMKIRPKSANVHKVRKRSEKQLLKKLVENDIDENDIMDKMKMAQKAIDAHRECIQELLQTATHSPHSVTRIKYPSAPDANGDIQRAREHERNEENDDAHSNRYNKMPNVTTRRVVFVNLDEDS